MNWGGINPLILTFDPKFLGYPSGRVKGSNAFRREKLHNKSLKMVHIALLDTVDGRNPAPEMYKTLVDIEIFAISTG